MSYKDHEVTGVRKVKWDGLWHVLYTISNRLDGERGPRATYDRVTRGVALRIEKRLARRKRR